VITSASATRRRMTKLAVLLSVCTCMLAGAVLAWAYFSATSSAQTNTFSAAAVDHITVSPASASIIAGGSQPYTDTAFDVSNNSFGAVTSTSTFTISPDGSCTGSSCTASVAGVHTVTGHFWGLTATATLTVLSADGAGSLTTTTTNVGNGSTGNTIVFTYTAATGGLSTGEVDIAVPAGWTAPTAANAIGCTTISTGTLSFAGQTIKVSALTLSAGGTLTVTYGAITGGACTAADGATATTTAGAATWQGQERSTSVGTLTNLAASPSINVLAADGSGTLSTPTSSVSASSTGNTIVFTYTVATGGISGGEVDIAAPTGWTAPVSTNAIGCTTVSSGALSFSGQTIKVSALTLTAGNTLTVTYGAISGGSCGAGDGATASATTGAQTWQGKEKSTSGGTLTNLAASPSITVFAVDGSGTLTTPTANVVNASTGNTIVFTYTAATGGLSAGEVDIAVPTGWTAPVSTNAIGCTTVSSGALSFSGQTIKVSALTLAGGGTVTVTYGATTGGACTTNDGATAPSTAGAATWQGQEKSIAGGALTNISPSPSINVLAANGSGTLTTTTTEVSASQSGQTIAFTYTAATGGLSAGAVTIVVPTGWTAPVITAAIGCTSASVGAVSTSGQTITVSNLTLGSGASTVVSYGATSGGACTAGDGATATATTGAQTWQGQEKSSAGGTLTNVGASPSITVFAVNGTGTLTTTTTNVANGSAGNSVPFLYTAATGGISNGTVTIVVPAGWTAPVTTAAIGCTSATLGTVSTSGQTITLSNLTLAAGGTTTVTYGATSGGACTTSNGATATTTAGAATWQAQEKSTAGGTLTNLGASPSINVLAADGSGTLSTPTANVNNGSTGNTIVFTYTAATGGLSGGEVDIAVPTGWTPPTAANVVGCTTVSAGTLSFTGQTIKVSALTLAGGGALTVTYGATTGGACIAGDGAKAPTTAGAATWQGQEKSSAGGSLTNVAISPSINVYAADGSGTLTTTTTTVNASSTGNSIAFLYTAATGGFAAGEVDIAVPTGWTAPTAANVVGCTTVSSGTLTFSGQTIKVSALTLAGGGTLTVTYGATSGGACTASDGATATATAGAQTWQGQQKSTAGGTLTNLGASPSIIVNAVAASVSIATVVRDSGNKKVHFTGSGTSGGAITITICAVNSFPCATPIATSTVTSVPANGNWTSSQDTPANLNDNTNYFAQAVQSTPSGTSAVFQFTVTAL
jgi:hypothetical protein